MARRLRFDLGIQDGEFSSQNLAGTAHEPAKFRRTLLTAYLVYDC